ncbi:hypothetical protein [Marinobacterium sedimentorum]|uniref:hypothetical protein n=1 Tax=Marinobacterium sedimentorum TaxID=2927804 RepID=UPI0020C680A9|nr:hypothetical protein [Marinobacterium sedimentorum]MCP8687500.1 hypothetical protein [Marinobacterium sedimentorum]
MKTHKLALAALIGSMTLSTAAMAADAAPESEAGKSAMSSDARQQMGIESKDKLEQALGVGKDKAHYTKTLEEMGFQVTSVNDSDETNLELEVVKADTTYEVEVEFDAETKLSTSVDVSSNVWETDATEQAKGENVASMALPTAAIAAIAAQDPEAGKMGIESKDKLEQALGVGKDKAHYTKALEDMGYKVTSVNDNDETNLELEVVKDDTSYEVEVKFDAETKLSTSVDVSSNVWETEATEKAKGEN